ncbi:hypothetical protein KC333_g9265 [Hortaea werneckii]|nr:hypothetical protein KC333_g9265 [Hortaea werneckii]KAI7300961.1 hypothetical protein KC326_g9243 [Hortaea werneckii]
MEDKMTDLAKFMKAHSMCMVSTLKQGDTGEQISSRCMGLAATERAGAELVFHTDVGSRKTDHLRDDPRVNVSFMDPGAGQWASIFGIANVVKDRDMVRKYYAPALRNWFGDLGDDVHNGGPEDPRIGLLVVRAESVSYAIVEEGMLGKEASNYQGELSSMPRINRMRSLTKKELDGWRDSYKT